ncbi:MAG: hypothetical protein ACMXX7_02680 [Candidatus Woesearchaeota archaeon]
MLKLNNPSKLLKIINETSPELAKKIASHHFNEIINSPYYEQIITLSSKMKHYKLNNFFDAIVMSTPYNQDQIMSIAKNSNSKEDYNHVLVESLKKNNKDLYETITNIDFDIVSEDSNYFHSRNPEDIITFADSTNSCIQGKSAWFYNDVSKDPGTIFIFGKRNQASGYVRLFVSQNMKGERILCVDNFKFNFYSREFIEEFYEKLVLFKHKINLPIVDRAVLIPDNSIKSKKFIEIKNDYYKVGKIPEKKVYSPIKLKEGTAVLYI